jgi:hypothetical protein
VPAEPYEDEWFWGEALWEKRHAWNDLATLEYQMPDNGTNCERPLPAETAPYIKVEGWKWVGFVYGEREPGEPRNLHPDAWMYVDDDVVYADWSVWRKEGEA